MSAGVVSPLRVNVIFHVDGRVLPNDLHGVRTGRFSKTKSLLVVQAAVQREPTADLRATLVDLLERAIIEAECYAARKRIAQELPEIRAILEQLKRDTSDPT